MYKETTRHWLLSGNEVPIVYIFFYFPYGPFFVLVFKQMNTLSEKIISSPKIYFLCWYLVWLGFCQVLKNVLNMVNTTRNHNYLKAVWYISNQLDCSPAPTCQLVKQISNSTWGCNVYYWVCKFLLVVGLVGVPIID